MSDRSATLSASSSEQRVQPPKPCRGVQLGYLGIGVLGNRPHEDLEGAIRSVAAAGADGVEVMQDLLPDERAAERLTALLAQHDLDCPGLHVFAEDVRTGEAREAVRAQLRALDAPRLIVSCTAEGWGADEYGRLAEELVELAAVAAEAGAELYFHPHDHEYAAMRSEARGLTVLLEDGPPGLKVVVDTYWARSGGHEPVELLTGLGVARADYVHAKTNGMEVGLAAVLDHARRERLEWVLVEEDEPGEDAQAELEQRLGELAAAHARGKEDDG
jgi:sugar phosphate isomerase/epimerase